jgi:hypothetical protein
VAAASPRSRGRLYLVRGKKVVTVGARGGVPSLERVMEDRETAGVEAWRDAPADAAWSAANPGDVLRAMDRFHPVPDVPERASSWAEWLYFNGGAGEARFYLTFLAGPPRAQGGRIAGVRLQLDRGGRVTSFGEGTVVDGTELIAGAPDLTIGRSTVRLEGLRYRIHLDLPRMDADGAAGASRVTADLTLDARPGRSLPPLMIRGARGWISGYVVPVMSGTLGGTASVDGERISLEGGTGYHDHNWGFWEGVSWQWGQVQHGGLSFVYGRVRPPPDAADPDRIPGFLAALGPEGPVGYAGDVSISETSDPETGRPRAIVVRGRGPALDLTMQIAVEDAVVTRSAARSFGADMDFLQLRGHYKVSGRAGDEAVHFEAAGSAETFRGH